jgi:hypothetical protein
VDAGILRVSVGGHWNQVEAGFILLIFVWGCVCVDKCWVDTYNCAQLKL